MLTDLRIRNLAVIEEVSLSLAPGLNVLTGETGAGKSIVIDALLLAIGARAQPDLIRGGADTATVEAVFEPGLGHPALGVLEEAGVGADEPRIVVRRELSRSGRHRVFVNDAPATVGLLERLGDVLVELHGQHEHQRLLRSSAQLAVLDRFCGEEMAGVMAERFGGWDAARRELGRVQAEVRDQRRQEELLRSQLAEIDAVAPQEGEEDELRAERRRLQHAERISAGLHEVLALLREDAHAAEDRVARAAALLRELSAYDVALGGAVEDLAAAAAHLEEAVGRARAGRDRGGFDPARLEEIDVRLDHLARLKRKYGDTVAALRSYREEVVARLDLLERHEEIVADLEGRARAHAESAVAEAVRLGEARAQGAARLERLMQRELRALGMEHARFRVALRREAAAEGDLRCGPGEWRVGPRGAETAEFLFVANPGDELRPLARVASGGELSRIMLAVKTVLAAADHVPTVVFDEVDAGIGGRVADVVGQKLAQVAQGSQVLCVTHVATIAAHADLHLVVDKRVARGSTRTTVIALDDAGRVEELARMLGGERITETTRRHAREVFRDARRPAAEPRR